MLKILFLEWSLEILSLCKEFSSDGVVGIDLAGDEILGEIPAMKGHINAFKVCCKLKPCIYLMVAMYATYSPMRWFNITRACYLERSGTHKGSHGVTRDDWQRQL